MQEWERYRPEVVDAVFQEMGAKSSRSKSDPESYAWGRMVDAVLRLASFTQEAGIQGVRADHLEVLARRLDFDSAEVFRRVKTKGGQIIDIL